MNRFTLSPRPHKRKGRSAVSRELEHLETRELLDGARLGPLVQVTGPSPFGDSSSEVEPYFAVNPANAQNMVGVWTQDKRLDGGLGGGLGIGVAVTLNGGHTWETGAVPGLTLDTGGTYQTAGDSWLSCAPSGDLYFSAIAADLRLTRSAIVVEKSTDGGLTWSAPTTLIQSDTPRTFNDKPSITADPTAPAYAYAVWSGSTSSRAPEMFSRTTNGGQSWDAPSTIFDPGGGTYAVGNIIVVSPDGTLNDFTNVYRFQPGQHKNALYLSRSSDKGQTWQKPIPVASNLSIGVTDPDTGQPVDSEGGPDALSAVAVDPHNGNLYAVWQDARFSNSQYDSIAFSMSTDGGCNWSAPIRVNQTPSNLPQGDQQAFLPSVAVAADGTVAVTYYDFRFNDASPGLLTDYWLVEGATGTDLTNPANWGNEARLTNSPFDLEKAAVWAGRGFFLGDYEGLAAAGNSFNAFFSATNGTDPGDIFFRDTVGAASTPVGAGVKALPSSQKMADSRSGAPLLAASDRSAPGLAGDVLALSTRAVTNNRAAGINGLYRDGLIGGLYDLGTATLLKSLINRNKVKAGSADAVVGNALGGGVYNGTAS